MAIDFNIHVSTFRSLKILIVIITTVFSFVFKIFRKGYRNGIKEDDVYEIVRYFSSEKLGIILEKELETRPKKTKMDFIKVLFKLFWKRYVLLALAVLIIETALM